MRVAAVRGADWTSAIAVRSGLKVERVAVHDVGRICGHRRDSVAHTVMAEPGCLALVTERWAERGARVERQHLIADNLAKAKGELGSRADFTPACTAVNIQPDRCSAVRSQRRGAESRLHQLLLERVVLHLSSARQQQVRKDLGQ